MGAILLRVRSWLRSHRGSALGLSVVVAIVCGIALTLLAGAVRTSTVVDRYESSRPFRYDVEIEQQSGAPRIDELESIPAIEHVEAATFVFGALVPPGGDDRAPAVIFAGSLAPVGEGLRQGRVAADGEPGEFVATQPIVDQLGLSVGDQVELLTITQEQSDAVGFDVDVPDGPTVAVTLVGVIDAGASELQSSFDLAVFDRSLLEVGDVGVAATVAVASLAPGASQDDLRQQLDALPEGEAFSIKPAKLISDDVRTAVDAQAGGVLVLAAIVAGAAVVVLAQVLSRQFRLSESERTVLRSIGFDRAQTAGEPLCRAALVVVLGSLGAAALAIAASGIFPLGFARRVEPDPGLRFEPLVHAVALVLFAALVLGVVALQLVVSRRETADRQPTPLVERVVSLVPSARAATAVRFAFGRGPRTGSTGTSLVGLVVVVGLVVAALTFGANLGLLLDEPERYGTNFDLAIGQGGESVPDEVVEALDADAEVSAVMLYGATTAAVGSRSVGIVGMEPVRGDLFPETIAGRLPQGDDEIALGRRIAGDLGVGVGDELSLARGSERRTFRITGIAVIAGIEESDLVGRNALVTAEGLRRLDPDDGMSSAVFDLAPGAPADAADRLSERLGLAVGPVDAPSDIVNLDRVRAVPFLVAATVGALAMLTLGHVMLVAVRRRHRDVAVLRALGATRRWVGGVVHWQATLITALAVAVAIPTGVAAGALLYRPYAEDIGARPDVSVPLVWIAAASFGLLVVANVAAAVPARRARRATPAWMLSRV
jgi:putative ABC transport system permease protein